jgi:hypothetical protein
VSEATAPKIDRRLRLKPGPPPTAWLTPAEHELSEAEQHALVRDRKLAAVLGLESFCWWCARRFGHGLDDADQEDIFAMVRAQLLRAVELFDPRTGWKFLTYVHKCCTRKSQLMARAIRSGGVKYLPKNAPASRPASLDERWENTGSNRGGSRGKDRLKFQIADYRRADGPDPALKFWCDPENVWQRRGLHIKFRLVLFLRHVEGYTLDEVGEVFGLSRERVRQLEERAVGAMARRRNARKLARQLEGRAAP